MLIFLFRILDMKNIGEFQREEKYIVTSLNEDLISLEQALRDKSKQIILISTDRWSSSTLTQLSR